MTEPKVPAAVALVTRGDLVLALTRGRGRPTDPPTWLVDLHLPGGKWEPVDGERSQGRPHWPPVVPDLAATAARELAEETGLRVRGGDLHHVLDLVSGSGRAVSAFAIQAPSHAPERFGATDAGQPAWVPPGALVQPWCTFRDECRAVLKAAGLAGAIRDLDSGSCH